MPQERSLVVIKKFLKDESGMETVEWAVVAVIIVAVVVIAFRGIAVVVQNRISTLNNEISQ
jgi:Flp pilus assembly pilin Flp